MKRFSVHCLLALVALCGLSACKSDPEAFNNMPEIVVDEASELLRTSAVLTGRIMAPANARITEYGFKVSSTSYFSSADTQILKMEEDLTSFSTQLTDLEIGKTYFYAAYATNGLEEMISTIKAFTTPTRSEVLLTDLQLVNEDSATYSARVGDTGGGEIHAVGFCWATDNTPTTYDETVITELDSDNTFTASLSGLVPGKTYYVRAFADSDILGNGTTQTISYSRDVLSIRLEEELPESKPETNSNKIFYTSTDGEIVEPNNAIVFGANIVSNSYENGQGVILFDGPVTSIGNRAFDNCTDLTSITIPDGVTSIGEWAFYNCTGLTGVTIPNRVTSIENHAFRNCPGLMSVTIGNGVTSIGEDAFRNCTGLTSITIPDSITSIENTAFSDCTGLTAFYGKFASEDNRCLIMGGVLNSFARSGLTSYSIPVSVTSIGEEAFYNCTGLTSITIPNSVTEIGKYAFYSCDSLTSVAIPDSVTSIEYAAFYCCSGLTSVTIGNGVASIGRRAFWSCSSLTSVAIPDSVTSIEESAFYKCDSLTSITIGNGVTSIGIGAFRFCESLTSVYCKPTTPPTGESNMFGNNSADRKIYVPNASVSVYKAAESWSEYASDIVGYDF